MFILARNGVQPTAQQAWGDWCNLIGTGFGVRPTTSTGDALEDAFVWIKPGGEGDVSLLLSFLCSSQLTRVIAGYL
jgi:cellulase/cellobiase CelA1